MPCLLSPHIWCLTLPLTPPLLSRIAYSHRHLGEYEFAEKALNLKQFSPQYKIRALHGAPSPTPLPSPLTGIGWQRSL
jgi:hypothetical protein